jgi:hypothetical protein
MGRYTEPTALWGAISTESFGASTPLISSPDSVMGFLVADE